MAQENYYSDAEAPSATAPSMPEQETETEEGSSDNQTAVIPKAILGGRECKPGEKLEFEVTDVMEDSVVVKFSGYKEEEPETETEEMPAPQPGAGGPMAAMME